MVLIGYHDYLVRRHRFAATHLIRGTTLRVSEAMQAALRSPNQKYLSTFCATPPQVGHIVTTGLT